jgi:hypothetical protein
MAGKQPRKESKGKPKKPKGAKAPPPSSKPITPKK